MKALLISESDEILNSYAAFFKETGYDTVCYRWLLKAMDNLEEIEPQLVFIDGFGYPRHWKTFAQYIKTSFKNAPLVLLAADLSEEEAKKADCLDVHCISGSIEDEQTRRDIVLLLHPEQQEAAATLQASAAADRSPEQAEVPATPPIQTAEPAEFAEPSEESANPEPTTAPSLNDGEPVSASAEELAECKAEPVQPEVEPAEQSAELIAATEQTEIGEPVESEELAKTADFSEPTETAEPVETADFPEPTKTVEPETFAPPPETDGQDTCAAEALPFFAATAEPEQDPEIPAEFAESIEAPGSAETVFEEPEPIDNEPFFKAVQPLSEQSAEPVDRQPGESGNTEEVEHTAAIGERSNEDEAFSFTFFHPRTKTAIYGSVISFKHPLLYFKPDDSSVLRTLRFGQKSSGVINDKGLASNVSVQIQGFENDSIELCLLK